jgi:putative ABC transport system permease protein
MSLPKRIVSLFRNLTRRRNVEQDLADEVGSYVELAIQRKVTRGLSETEARRTTLIEFGGVEQVKEQVREARLGYWIETCAKDLRFGFRSLWKSPGFAIAALIALALGIGANTAIFSVVNAALLRPLPYRNPERIVTIEKSARAKGLPGIPSAQYLAWRTQAGIFEQLAAFSNDNFNLTGGGEPERISCALVTANLFSLFAVEPIHGRTFLAGEDAPGANPVVVVSQGFWQRRCGSDPSLVGRTMTLNGKPRTIVGIMPEQFRFPGGYEIWMPLVLNPAEETNARMTLVQVVGRLQPNISPERAQSDLELIGKRLVESGTEGAATMFVVTPLHEQLVGSFRPKLFILFGAVGLVLLIACANVGNLLLARMALREKEMAIRAAVGASRSQLVRQLLTESAVLGLLGGALGVLLSYGLIGPLVSLVPERIASSIQGVHEIGPDLGALTFTLGISCLTVVMFGLAPAVQGSKPHLNESLKDGRGSQNQIGRGTLRDTFVVGEIALTLILLVGAGLLIKSFDRLSRIEPGFTPSGVLSARVELPRSRYGELNVARNFYQRLIERVSALPGVSAVGLTNHRPLDGFSVLGIFEVEGAPPTNPKQRRPIPIGVVSADYFRALGIPLLAGELFTGNETASSRQVVLVNQSFARNFFGGAANAIGKRTSVGCTKDELCSTIIGVVGDIRQEGLIAEPVPEIYAPFTQSLVGSMTLMVRANTDPAALVAPIRNQVLALDPEQPISEVRTLGEYLAQASAQSRSLMLLLVRLAAAALALAAVGIYGVVSYSVAQRTREFGIRMALGAHRRDVFGLVIGQGFKLATSGIAVGLAGAFALTRLMTSLLYDVSAVDPWTFGLVTVFLAGISLLACYLPARRAVNVSPMDALRYE